MTLFTFDYQGVFHTKDGKHFSELYSFLHQLEEPTAILSNLPHVTLVHELTSHGAQLSKLSIYGYEDMHSKAEAITTLQTIWNPTETIFVTDSVRDIEDVSRTNATILAVSWGYDTARDLQTAHPHVMLYSAKKLIDYLHLYL
jgi:phosphoglycolate phosphatase-like HAD superfamily hydrolase